MTRDRVAVVVELGASGPGSSGAGSRRVEFIDTGGLGLVDAIELKAHVEAQIEVALSSADLILFMVDGKTGLVPGDQFVAERLRRLAKPHVLVVNKVESVSDELAVHEWSGIGFGEPIAVSAQEGFGFSDLVARILTQLPPPAAEPEANNTDVLSFAIVGKRNAGKSTLTNLLVGDERVIVSEIPGTTRDAVDVEFEHHGRRFVAIDTAGARKKTSIQDAIEFFSHARSTESIRRADAVILLFDVAEPISQVDKSVASYIVEQHKPVLIVGNKIDLAERIVLDRWDAYIKQQMPALRYAPVSFISAKDGRNVAATLDLLVDLRRQARTTFGTGELNRCLRQAQERQRPRTKKMPKLYYGTQLSTEPLRVLVFVNEPKLFKGNYGRYLENALRDHFAVPEVPIDVVFRRRARAEGGGGDPDES